MNRWHVPKHRKKKRLTRKERREALLPEGYVRPRERLRPSLRCGGPKNMRIQHAKVLYAWAWGWRPPKP